MIDTYIRMQIADLKGERENYHTSAVRKKWIDEEILNLERELMRMSQGVDWWGNSLGVMNPRSNKL